MNHIILSRSYPLMSKYFSLFLYFVFNACYAAGPAPLYFYEFDTTYTLKREGSIVGEIKRSVTEENGRYSFSSITKTTGLVSLFYTNDVKEKSNWTMIQNKIIPIEYDYFRDKNGKLREVNIKFDRQNQSIVTKANESIWSMPLQEEVYDKLLYEIVIMQRLNQGLPINDFKIADGGELKTYSFKTIGKETLSTAIGELNTLKLVRHKSNNKQSVSIWYAIDKDYLPVKVENVDKEGKTYTAMIKDVKLAK